MNSENTTSRKPARKTNAKSSRADTIDRDIPTKIAIIQNLPKFLNPIDISA